MNSSNDATRQNAEGSTEAEKSEWLSLGDTAWKVWRQVGVRGAGLPVSEVLRMGAPSSVQIIDEMLGCRRTLDEVSETRGTNESANKDAVAARLKALQEKLAQTFETESVAVFDRLREVARQDQFREAITWQNRRAIDTCLDSLLRHPERNNSQARQKLELVARYLQRYCTKNDTIGFFGPVGWAEVSEAIEGARIEPGDQFLAHREVFFEVWCLNLIAKELSRDPRLRPHIKPRRYGFIRFEGDQVWSPMCPPVQLSAVEAAVLHRCDGQLTARELAADVVEDAGLELSCEDDVFEVLDGLRTYVSWAVEVPVSTHPETTLCEALDRIEDAAVRAELGKPLEKLENARQRVARAAGDPGALAEAIDHLNQTFAELTGEESTRRDGEYYAGRALVYEDTRRACKVRLGVDTLARLSAPLSLLMLAARWFTFEFGRRFYQFAHQYLESSTEEDAGGVSLLHFEFMTKQRRSEIAAEVARELEQKWEEILEISDEDDRSVTRSSEELRAKVEATFDVEGPGWTYGRFHGPDIMCVAESPEAFEKGDLTFVMGEVHAGRPTLENAFFKAMHPQRQSFWDCAQELDYGSAVFFASPKEGPAVNDSGRIAPVFSTRDFLVQLDAAQLDHPAPRVIPAGQIMLRRRGDQLRAESVDGRFDLDLVEFYGFLLSLEVVSEFRITSSSRSYTPRVTIDELVIQREQWRFDLESLEFSGAKTRLDRFTGARRWASQYDLPRFCFVKISGEPKPEFVDWQSPVYVESFCRIVRRAIRSEGDGHVAVTEMLPTHEQLWLNDHKGETYTCEFRFNVFDPAETVQYPVST